VLAASAANAAAEEAAREVAILAATTIPTATAIPTAVMPAAVAPQVCINWARTGSCRNGETCQLLHGMEMNEHLIDLCPIFNSPNWSSD
jgi:hypothetical protein